VVVARTYTSQLRADQADATRTRILGAAARVFARPLPDFSIPAVAGEAGVSVATVYRHFKTKADLMDGLTLHYMGLLASAAGVTVEDTLVPPAASVDQIYPTLRAVFERQASLDPAMQAALASPMADEMRRKYRKVRLRRVESWLAPITKGLDPQDRRRLVELYLVLSSSAARRSFEVLVGVSPGQAAEVVGWAVKRLIAHLKND
jgi:AcrR family transcriptional regulator